MRPQQFAACSKPLLYTSVAELAYAKDLKSLIYRFESDRKYQATRRTKMRRQPQRWQGMVSA